MKQTMVLFNAPIFTAKDYDHVWEELRVATQSHPKGLIFYIGFAKSDDT
jgi:hypothetical protein